MDILVVDLEVGGVNQVLHVLTGIYGLKDMFEGSRNDAPLNGGISDALHGEGFATTRLSVGKHGAIVAFKNSLERIIIYVDLLDL